MLNRNPSKTSNVLNSYRKRRQQRGPFLIYGAVALVIIGGIMLVVWLTRPGQPLGELFATDTPTVTVTFTPTITSTPTETPTITPTGTTTITSTPSEPFPYTVQEGDLLQTIAEKFNLGQDGVLLIYDINPAIQDSGGVIYVGQTIQIPVPGTTRSTSTSIPSNLARGTKIEYSVLPGDTLAGIAAKFNSKEEDIITTNDIPDANALQVGQVLQIPVNLVTATATLPSTSTPITPTVAGQQATAATTATTGSTAGCTFDENAQFVSDLQKLINDERAKAGLPALSVNAQLTAAAKAHAVDMLCNNYLSRLGLDGSTPEQRVKAQGFNASLVLEDLYALHPAYGGNPQSAFNWWMSDPTSKGDLLNANTTVFGIAYVTSDKSLLGGYFVVVSAKP